LQRDQRDIVPLPGSAIREAPTENDNSLIMATLRASRSTFTSLHSGRGKRWEGRHAFACFLPVASSKALTSINRTVRRWALHHCRDKSLQDLAAMYNACIRGWINYYNHFYKTQLRPTLKRTDLYVILWARRKFKRLRRKTKGARDWFDRLRRVDPTLFAH
jgi:Group II intron, maturase-specific domain